jgi:hypothetical protein
MFFRHFAYITYLVGYTITYYYVQMDTAKVWAQRQNTEFIYSGVNQVFKKVSLVAQDFSDATVACKIYRFQSRFRAIL